jgi:TPR repeat protein
MRIGFWLALFVILASNIAILPVVHAASDSTAIRAPTTVLAVPGAETPLNISVEASGQIPPQVMLVVRGLPSTAKLSEGRLFGAGVWVVPINALAQLKVYAPDDASGNANLDIALVTLDGASLSEAKMALSIGQPLENTNSRELTEAERAFANKMVEKGDESIKIGNVAAARQFYRSAADRGLPEAALALGATYDAAQLRRMKGVLGIQPDPTEARKWYTRARELGAHDADARLQGLN